MRHRLFCFLATVFVGLTAFRAYAQIPNVQWFFDANLTQTAFDCDGTTNQFGYIVAVNFNAFISAVEYKINYPTSGDILWVADISVHASQLNIGNTTIGVASAWSLPLNCFQPTVIMQVLYDWRNCGDCTPIVNLIQLILAGPDPTSGRLRFVRFPDNAEFDAIGMTSLVCGAILPVAETTWGQVKALYE
ncbi:MAG: hypothetical protein IH969_04815 [Candidatus Krumholzibacteriota bacterium]|nr:hypothetical protein [Candidatus Krumholzibacteriota bacterium]